MILDEILERTEERVAALPPVPRVSVPRRTLSLAGAIGSPRRANAVIAELKLASPSRGPLRHPGDLEGLARDFTAAGSTALSVITEPFFFGGSPAHLARVRAVTDLPILRKDFIIDARQLDETRALGADAVLLMARVLGGALPRFVNRAAALGLEPLVEVHTDEEAAFALSTRARLIGINNRDLGSLTVDLATTRRLAPGIRAAGRLVVAESGIACVDDLRALRPVSDAFLVGTALTSAAEPGKTLEELLCA